MTKKKAFSFKTDGPLVTELYKSGKAVSTIAKELGRGYQTIKNYLEHEGLYTGPAPAKGRKKMIITGKAPEVHVPKAQYICTRHNTTAVFKHYYNGACLVWLPDPDFQFYAYCKPNELIER